MTDMPDFPLDALDGIIGRSTRARGGLAVVDITRSAMVIHQNHDYSHLPAAYRPTIWKKRNEIFGWPGDEEDVYHP